MSGISQSSGQQPDDLPGCVSTDGSRCWENKDNILSGVHTNNKATSFDDSFARENEIKVSNYCEISPEHRLTV